jgi:hypothetical protein
LEDAPLWRDLASCDFLEDILCYAMTLLTEPLENDLQQTFEYNKDIEMSQNATP